MPMASVRPISSPRKRCSSCWTRWRTWICQVHWNDVFPTFFDGGRSRVKEKNALGQPRKFNEVYRCSWIYDTIDKADIYDPCFLFMITYEYRIEIEMIRNVCKAIISHPYFGLYQPPVVRSGMVYYCSTDMMYNYVPSSTSPCAQVLSSCSVKCTGPPLWYTDFCHKNGNRLHEQILSPNKDHTPITSLSLCI